MPELTIKQRAMNARLEQDQITITILMDRIPRVIIKSVELREKEALISLDQPEYDVLTVDCPARDYFYQKMEEEGFSTKDVFTSLGNQNQPLLVIKLGTKKITLMDRVMAQAAIGDCPDFRDIITNSLFYRVKAIIEFKLIHRKEPSAIIRISDDEELLLGNLADSKDFYAKMEEEGFSEEHITFSGNYIEIDVSSTL